MNIRTMSPLRRFEIRQIRHTVGEYSQYWTLSPHREVLSTSGDIIHYLCLISEIVSLILNRVSIQRWVMARNVIPQLNHLRQIMTECVSQESVLLSWFNIFPTFSCQRLKYTLTLLKRLLGRVIIPGGIMTLVVNHLFNFTKGHNSTWNYDPSIIILTVEYGG